MRMISGLLGAVMTFIAIPNIMAQEANPEGKSTLYYLDLFGEALERVRDEYVTEKTDQELIEAAITGMLESLDPHSVYLNERSFNDLRTNSRGEFGGLGIEVTLDQETGAVKVVSPIDDTPAAKAGLRANDLITHIDGQIVQGLSLSDAVDKMRGKVGDPITLIIAREGVESFEVTLVRDRIKISSSRHRLEGNVGYIRINQFNGNATANLKNAVKELKAEADEPLVGYVLDLRNNPGGLLDQAVTLSDQFLDQGEIVSTRGRNALEIQRFQAKRGDIIDGLPLVVLINGGSASASEIVAGALQDHQRAVIVGTDSFGKGSVQTMIPLSSEGSALKLTTQHYYTPSGESIQGRGISPDIHVPLARLEPIFEGERVQERNLPGALDNPDDASETEAQEETGDEEIMESEDDFEDNQLQTALDVVRALSIFKPST